MVDAIEYQIKKIYIFIKKIKIIEPVTAITDFLQWFKKLTKTQITDKNMQNGISLIKLNLKNNSDFRFSFKNTILLIICFILDLLDKRLSNSDKRLKIRDLPKMVTYTELLT
ncbi:hypothetical protein ACTFIW_003758 [Dictyostelium discoideum]